MGDMLKKAYDDSMLDCPEKPMTSKLKCPVCDVPLTECGDLLSCPNDHCGWVGNAALWQALIQAKQDLEIARKALKEIRKEMDNDYMPDFAVISEALKALEQIEQKE